MSATRLSGPPATPLGREIARLIALEGPMPVERYMELCLGHPTMGYYITRNPFGADGDFITAPDISQIFGELIGLWCAEVWRMMGGPRDLHLVELGPGRGALIADALRAARVAPQFRSAVRLSLVETSPVLRQLQRQALSAEGELSSIPVAWRNHLGEVPEGPMILIANEFFDALPVRQYQRAPDGWRERLVGLAPDGGLIFGLAPEAEPALDELPGDEGAIMEIPVAAINMVAGLADRLRRFGGAALIIDYGHAVSAVGDTLQAVRRHQYVHPLSTPGEADITAHVDFGALARAALARGVVVDGPVEQGAFLRALGANARAEQLKRNAREAQRRVIDEGLRRLTSSEAGGMGALFKVMAVAASQLGPLPGLAPRREAPHMPQPSIVRALRRPS
ncbi:class I SAM-dependent methyltransferase [Camelimonas abortus]|uniref:Class I SAM-dependent methyltransferase n=1 Tax=Camelimonas abortus TaxID=1017184 RepID=A0ABV7LBN3_9HYPH